MEEVKMTEAAVINKAVKDVLQELDAMIGLTEVKKTVHNIANKIVHEQKFLEQTGKTAAVAGNNIVITGNTGTGKTAIVRMLAKLFKAINLLPDDNPLEIHGADFKASYIGQSKYRVDEYCRQAIGRVLFIDEIAALVNEQGPVDMFANEVLITLMSRMENDRDKFICIVAGSQKEMDLFLDKSNPGMRRRFTHFIDLD